MTRTKAISLDVANEGLPVLMTTREVAQLLRVDASTLSRWRLAGTGPQVTWLSPNLPRYQRVHVLAWLQRVAA